MGSDNKPQNDITTGANEDVNIVKVIMPVTVSLGIGFAIGLGITTTLVTNPLVDSAKSADKITMLRSEDLHWIFISIVLLGRMISYINFFPMGFKSHLKGNLRSNPFFYQTTDGDMVSLQDKGAIGKYNRANRSIGHMLENFGSFLASIVPVGYVYPKPVFALVSIFCLGRISHQAGYTVGYGKHAVGFLLSLISIVTMEGLALLIFLKAIEIM